MKKLDMFDVIIHRCTGTSLVLCEHYLIKEAPLFLICCIRADQDMQEHEQSRDKLQQSTLQAWRQLNFGASTFMNIHDSICFMNSPCWSLHLQCVPHVYVMFIAGGTYEAMGQSHGQIPLDVRGQFFTTPTSMLLGFRIRNKSIY